MYENFYGLSSKPFQLNPDPSFYFGSKQHSRARSYLEYGVSCDEGFVVVTGEIGAGKTTILRRLIDSLHGTNVVIGQLVTSQLDAEDTLRMVGAAFGLKVTDAPKSQILVSLEAFLLTQTSQGRRCLLIVDEAQNLSARAVEELRMLSNFQFGTKTLLQSFLVGQPEFREILQRPEMEQFRQRVTASCHIGPLDSDETHRYIEHRLKRAGSTGKPSFDDDVYQAVHVASGGIPRQINSICERLLLLGFLAEKTHLSAADVAEVIREFEEERAVPMRPPRAANGIAHVNGNGKLLNGSLSALSELTLDEGVARALSGEIGALGSEQGLLQLQRLEGSVLRLERINQQTLSLLQQLIGALRKSSDGHDDRILK